VRVISRCLFKHLMTRLELVYSLFPRMCFIHSYTDIFPALERHESKNQNENSKRRVNRGAAAPPGLSHSWPQATSLGVESKAYRASLGICRDAGGRVFVKLKALLCLNHCRFVPLIYLFPSLLASSLPFHPQALAQSSSSCSGSSPGSSSSSSPSSGSSSSPGSSSSSRPSSGSSSGSCSCLGSRSSPGSHFCSGSHFSSSSRFRPPSPVSSVGQIAHPCQPMVKEARAY
jgi:hypothetical protein